MSIKDISSSLPPARPPETTGVSPVKKNEAAASGRIESAANDSISLKNEIRLSEVQLGKELLHKLDTTSVGNLRDVKAKIDSGFFESEAVQQKVAGRLGNEISKIERDSIVDETKKNELLKESLTKKEINTLLNDERTIDTIANKLLDDIKRLE